MYIKVIVTSGARRERVEAVEEVFHISVKEAAQGNHANVRVREIIAELHNVPYHKVSILRGHRSRGKMLMVTA